MINRLAMPLFLALLTTIGLFYVMQLLIANNQLDTRKVESLIITQFVRVPQPRQLTVQTPKVIKPPEPDTVPPMPALRQFITGEYTTIITPVKKLQPVDPQFGGSARSDGSYLPIVKVLPIYPRRALSRGLSGWVVVEFTVTSNGTVQAPQVLLNCAHKGSAAKGVCTESPNSVFDRAALEAVAKFKYMPKMVNGQEVQTSGVQNKIKFDLAAG
ncbi:MAG: TonB family protein [Pseudomonadales bacterium]|nr:TonB family protein [Pseudomonadales bacterium]